MNGHILSIIIEKIRLGGHNEPEKLIIAELDKALLDAELHGWRHDQLQKELEEWKQRLNDECKAHKVTRDRLDVFERQRDQWHQCAEELKQELIKIHGTPETGDECKTCQALTHFNHLKEQNK